MLTSITTLLLFVSSLAVSPEDIEAKGCNYRAGVAAAFDSATVLPGWCWRPYADGTPFNRRIGKRPPLLPGSRAIVRRLVDGVPPLQIVAGDPVRDGGTPIYWAESSDPDFTLHCTADFGGQCPIEGMRIDIPDAAVPTAGVATPEWDHDAHMTVVDPVKQWEYDLWHVEEKPAGGGDLYFGWGGRLPIDGTGRAHVASGSASRMGTLGGVIRTAEFRAGRINHALAMVVPCTDHFVYPAGWIGGPCADYGLPSENAVPMGAHFQLKMSKRTIAELNVPRWKKAILTALSTYGAYATDTTEDANAWGFEVESGASHTSFGLPDPLVEYGKKLGLEPQDFNGNGHMEYWFDLPRKVKWERMRIVDPCVAEGTC
jgi:hypothetical protein